MALFLWIKHPFWGQIGSPSTLDSNVMPNRIPIYWVSSPFHDQICDSTRESNITPRNVSPAPPQLARPGLGTAKPSASLICIKPHIPRTTPGVIQACRPLRPHIPRPYYYYYYIYLIINTVYTVKRKNKEPRQEKSLRQTAAICKGTRQKRQPLAGPQSCARADTKNDRSAGEASAPVIFGDRVRCIFFFFKFGKSCT